MPTPLLMRRRAARAFADLAARPGPQLALILVLSLMVLAAGLNRLTPSAPATWVVDIATP